MKTQKIAVSRAKSVTISIGPVSERLLEGVRQKWSDELGVYVSLSALCAAFLVSGFRQRAEKEGLEPPLDWEGLHS